MEDSWKTGSGSATQYRKTGPRDETVATRSLLTEVLGAALRKRTLQGHHYFSEVLTEVNTVFRLVPSPLTAAMIASAMPAAIRPYSIAVAPASSAKKRLM